MKNGWIAILQRHDSIARQMAERVPGAFADPNLTFDQASLLCREVEDGAKAFDAIVERMHHEDLDPALYETAEALEVTWSRVSVAAVNKLRDMRGLPPIDAAPNDEPEDENHRPIVLQGSKP